MKFLLSKNFNKELIKKVAKDNKIPYQLNAISGMSVTDASAMKICRGGGSKTLLISLPQRYMHTPSEVISLKDLKNMINLVFKFLKSI